MITSTIHLDADNVTIKRTRGMRTPTVALYDGRGGYLTIFLNERSIEMLARTLEECKLPDVEEVSVAQNPRR